MKIFVTGGMGSGKSTFTDYLASLGASVIYADLVGHDNLANPVMKQELVSAFGDQILDAQGVIIRSELAARAFSSPENTHKLDSITQSYLYNECLRRLEEAEKSCPVVVLEMAILDGRDNFFRNADIVVCVTASSEIRIQRLVEGRAIPEEDAKNRIARQVPEECRIAISDVVFVNDGSIKDFQKRIFAWLQEENILDLLS